MNYYQMFSTNCKYRILKQKKKSTLESTHIQYNRFSRFVTVITYKKKKKNTDEKKYRWLKIYWLWYIKSILCHNPITLLNMSDRVQQNRENILLQTLKNV